MRGLPGSGKSTWAEKYAAKNKGTEIVSADKYWIQPDGKYVFEPSRLGDAHAFCMREFMFYVSGGAIGDPEVQHVIVDNTNVDAVSISPYMLVAAAYKVHAEIVQFNCDIDLSCSRNIHNVPRRTIEHMARQLGNRLPPYWPIRMVG